MDLALALLERFVSFGPEILDLSLQLVLGRHK
jgi:hypothetical protein